MCGQWHNAKCDIYLSQWQHRIDSHLWCKFWKLYITCISMQRVINACYSVSLNNSCAVWIGTTPVLYESDNSCAVWVGQLLSCMSWTTPVLYEFEQLLCCMRWTTPVLQSWTTPVLYELNNSCAVWIEQILCCTSWTTPVQCELNNSCAAWIEHIEEKCVQQPRWSERISVGSMNRRLFNWQTNIFNL